MIVDFFFHAVSEVITTVFAILPNLPEMPEAISDGGDWVISMISQSAGLIAWLYGAPLYLALIASLVALMNFEHIYHLTMWIWRKLPINSK